jgi:peptidoglycan hydrolase-like protein with peptidoglycan-binding domain
MWAQLDGKPGRKTTSALMEFQRTYGLRPDGKPGPLTQARLEAIFRSACDAPGSKRFLDPQHKGDSSLPAWTGKSVRACISAMALPKLAPA